jgi:hypothetical protein
MTAADVLQALAARYNGAFTFARYSPPANGASRARSLTGDERRAALLSSSDDSYFTVEAARLRRWGSLSAIRKPTTADETIALCSTVGARRLLLLDFKAPVTAENTAEILACARLLGWSGWLLNSGSSYHWIGAELFSVSDWTSAMATALLLPVQIDVRYMGHSMWRGLGAARLFACTGKPHEPVVIGSVGVG